MSLASPSAPRSWKREPLVWMLIGIPLSAVVMGVVMITLAINSYSGLVVDDYYRQGKQINRVLARDRLAWELGLKAELRLQGSGQIEIRFAPSNSFIPGDRVELNLVHATRPDLDQHLSLANKDGEPMRAELSLPGPGRWNLYLQTADWRLVGSLQSPQQATTQLLPNYFPR